MAANPVLLNSTNPLLMPQTVTENIFKKASETSAVMSLARRVPLALNANTVIPVSMDVPTAGWVSEGGVKPVGSTGMGVKTMSGKKVALLVPVSEELVRVNPVGIIDQLQQDLPTAIARAFDYAAIHGLDLKTGGAGPFGDYLAKTAYSQTIGATSAANGGVYNDLVNGIKQVVNGPVPGYDFSGFACDPRLKPELMQSYDVNGRPLWLGTDAGALNANYNAGSIIGYPAFYNTGVSGKYYRQGNAVQVVTISGTPTGGNFTLSIGGSVTGNIAYNASAATVQTAIQALSTAAAAAATVTGSTGGPYTVTFTQAATTISVASNGLTGGSSPSVAVAATPNLDSGLRAIGGDWSQCAYGVGMDITFKRSTEANYFDGSAWHSAFQENLILLLVEAYYGFVVADPNAFVAYTHAPGS